MLIIFNIYRILRETGQNYSSNLGLNFFYFCSTPKLYCKVQDNQVLTDQIVDQESQGFDEYTSSKTQGNIHSLSKIEEESNLNAVIVSSTQTAAAASNVPNMVPLATVTPAIPASLSLQLNEGNFYDEKQFHDEDDSMAEYGLGENGQFNDDGSFIGLYGRDRIQNYMAQFNRNLINNNN